MHSSRSSTDPVRLLVDINHAAKVWFILFLVAILALICCLAAQLFPQTKALTRYIVVDSRGVTQPAVDVLLAQATNVHFRAAADATSALLDRRPNDFDHPELLGELFLPKALDKARAWCESERPQRTSRSLHQKAEPSHYHYARLNDDRVLVTVQGQVILVGNVGGQPLVDSARFTLELQFVTNPDLTSNAQHPLLVSNFRYETVTH